MLVLAKGAHGSRKGIAALCGCPGFQSQAGAALSEMCRPLPAAPFPPCVPAELGLSPAWAQVSSLLDTPC